MNEQTYGSYTIHIMHDCYPKSRYCLLFKMKNKTKIISNLQIDEYHFFPLVFEFSMWK